MRQNDAWCGQKSSVRIRVDTFHKKVLGKRCLVELQPDSGLRTRVLKKGTWQQS
jgi:hypothetical protein